MQRVAVLPQGCPFLSEECSQLEPWGAGRNMGRASQADSPNRDQGSVGPFVEAFGLQSGPQSPLIHSSSSCESQSNTKQALPIINHISTSKPAARMPHPSGAKVLGAETGAPTH